MKFAATVEKITSVKEHPNADRLKILDVNGTQIVSNRSDLETGNIVLLVPENAIVPEYLLRQGFWNEEKGHGFLSGKGYDRVTPVKLRGVVSNGVIFSPNADGSFTNESGSRVYPDVGDDLTEFMKIKKYSPKVPATMSGDVFSVGVENTVNFDIEPYSKNKDKISIGDIVVVTEKIHGTCCHFIVLDNGVYASSKGISKDGFAFKNTSENIQHNVYVRALYADGMIDKLEKLKRHIGEFVLIGEIFGKGIQDLHYGMETPEFRVFDIYILKEKRYVNANEFFSLCERYQIETVPVIYSGPLTEEVIRPNIDVHSTFASHISEGIVIWSRHKGRNKYKVVYDQYHSRRGKKTEYQ